MLKVGDRRVVLVTESWRGGCITEDNRRLDIIDHIEVPTGLVVLEVVSIRCGCSVLCDLRNWRWIKNTEEN